MIASPVTIRQGGLDHPAVAALLAFHVAEAHGDIPAEFSHALSVNSLRDPSIAFFAGWDSDTLLGIGALKVFEPGHGEIKSMRTAPDHLRRGVARAMLTHLIATARASGLGRISLETGTAPRFAPANALYEAFGFVDRDAFGGYPPSEHNRFLTLAL